MDIESPAQDKSLNQDRVKGFKRGFLLWFLVAGILVLPCWFIILLSDFMVRDSSPGQSNFYFSLPLFINGIIIWRLFSKSKWLGWGVLAAIGLNILINLIAFSLVPDTSLSSWMEDFNLNALGLVGLLNLPIWVLIIFSVS